MCSCVSRYLLEGVDFEKLPAALFRAPFALLAHNKFQVSPVAGRGEGVCGTVQVVLRRVLGRE